MTCCRLCILVFAIVYTGFEVNSETSFSTGATGYSCPTLFNFYGDVYDCTKFYRCFWGEAFSFKCPSGTRWSQSLLTCDHEQNVHCGASSKEGYITAPASTSSEAEHAQEAVTDTHHDDDSSSNSHYDYSHDGWEASNNYYYAGYNDGYQRHNYGNKNYASPYAGNYHESIHRPYGYAPPSYAGYNYGYNHGYNYGYPGYGYNSYSNYRYNDNNNANYVARGHSLTRFLANFQKK